MAKRSTSKNTGAKKLFNISNVEGDIRRQKSTAEICEIYGKEPQEVAELISKAYRGSGGKKVRELTAELEKNDKLYEKRMNTKARKESRAEEEQQEQPKVVVVLEKTPQQLQEETVAAAKHDYDAKNAEYEAAEEDVRKAMKVKKEASAKVDQAKAALDLAKEEYTRADDAVMMAESKKYTAEKALAESRSIYETEAAKLEAMVKPKLIHLSAIKSGIPMGKVFISKFDYELLSKENKEKVTPVDTAGCTLANYPENFYLMPTKMNMAEYQSACNYALAYIKLVLEANADFNIELICNDAEVKALAEIQLS